MRLFSALVLAGAMLVLPALSLGDAAAHAQEAAAAPKLTFDGDTALWTISIKPDKVADFEKVIGKLHEGLMKSEKPERKQQAAGWKIMKLSKAMPDGNIPFVHIIHPVVKGADYTVMAILYEAFPEERQALYDLYRGAFAANLSLAVGTMAGDLSKNSQ